MMNNKGYESRLCYKLPGKYRKSYINSFPDPFPLTQLVCPPALPLSCSLFSLAGNSLPIVSWRDSGNGDPNPKIEEYFFRYLYVIKYIVKAFDDQCMVKAFFFLIHIYLNFIFFNKWSKNKN